MKILKTITNAELEKKLQKYFFVITGCQAVIVDINYDEVYIKIWGRDGVIIRTFTIELPYSDEEYLFDTFEDLALFATSNIVRILVN